MDTGAFERPSIEEVISEARKVFCFTARARTWTWSVEHRKDLEQDVLEHIVRIYDRIDQQEWRAFVRKHVRGKVLDQIRATYGRIDKPTTEERRALNVDFEDLIALETMGVEDLYQLDLERILGLLAPADARLVRLHFIEGYDLTEIALMFHVTESRVCQILTQILERLKGELTRGPIAIPRGLKRIGKVPRTVKRGSLAQARIPNPNPELRVSRTRRGPKPWLLEDGRTHGTAEDVAEILGVSASHIKVLTCKGIIPKAGPNRYVLADATAAYHARPDQTPRGQRKVRA